MSKKKPGGQEKIPFKYQILSPDSVDAAAVLLRSAERKRGGQHNITYLALITPEVDDKWAKVIEKVGYTTKRIKVPINASVIRNPTVAASINKDGKLGINEMVKIEPLSFAEYDWVLMVDSDFIVHGSFDKLFDDSNAHVALQWTAGGVATELVNGGFLLFNPQAKDAIKHRNAVLDILLEGEYDRSTGWRHSGVGKGTFGGQTIQGLLPYYFLHVMNGTASAELDRCKYNNMVQIQRCKEYPVEDVTSNHFTGDCTKPWACFAAKTRGLKTATSIHPMCHRFQEAWWLVWVEFAEEVGAPSNRCGTFVSQYLYSKL